MVESAPIIASAPAEDPAPRSKPEALVGTASPAPAAQTAEDFDEMAALLEDAFKRPTEDRFEPASPRLGDDGGTDADESALLDALTGKA